MPNDASLGTQELAATIARALLDGFDRHYRLFRETSRQAKARFESAAWQEVQRANRGRTLFYDRRVIETEQRIVREFATETLPESIWQQVKFQYIGLLTNHKQPELAETFFNSVCCRILHRSYYHNDFIFVRPAASTEYIDSEPPAYRSYYPLKSGLRSTLARIIADFDLQRPFADLRRDIRCLVRAVRRHLRRPFTVEANHQIQVLSTLFYRNKGAYAVGKIINGHQEYPFAVPILHDADGKLYLDAILLEQDEFTLLFSLSRAYFMVDMEVPSAYVQFLSSLLPRKPRAEIYTILGLQKQGKTMFYRDFLHHLKHSSDDFVIAPGIKGLVMVVFTLPSYPYVFKVIRDDIAPPKEVNQETVKEKYLLVKLHDRVGRMADTLEYKDVALPHSRFSKELLEELRLRCPSLLEEDGDTVLIRHVYIERRMVPLNIYLNSASDSQKRHAMREYGNAIRELAIANIFPGDMLFKNFGVTRLGRVVFYDYDEIAYMTECNFRRIPPPRTPEDEMSAEPWYSVGPHDVFPEEFGAFLLSDPKVRECFLEYHGDLLEPDFWVAAQQRSAAGYIEDVFPYRQELRFCNRFAGLIAPGADEDTTVARTGMLV